ncbi:MAG TPA: hypothetical protein VGC32_09650 [Solirubrobacterales bacterium]
MSAGSEQTEPATPTPPTPPSDSAAPPAMPSMAAFGSSESCPNCSTRMAADQRYCLNCGHRRGDPRLPFMDAVVFMESMNSAPGGAGGGGTPPPPPTQSGGSNNRWNANAALIAGVATLVLAIGVGFLIGRTGHDDNSSANNGGGVKIVQVGGTGGEVAPTPEEAVTPGESGGSSEKSTGSKAGGGKAGKPAKEKSATEKTKIKEGSAEETEAIEEAQNEVLHATGKQAKPGAQVGESCEKGTPGCEDEEFTGNFFGE